MVVKDTRQRLPVCYLAPSSAKKLTVDCCPAPCQAFQWEGKPQQLLNCREQQSTVTKQERINFWLIPWQSTKALHTDSLFSHKDRKLFKIQLHPFFFFSAYSLMTISSLFSRAVWIFECGKHMSFCLYILDHLVCALLVNQEKASASPYMNYQVLWYQLIGVKAISHQWHSVTF